VIAGRMKGEECRTKSRGRTRPPHSTLNAADLLAKEVIMISSLFILLGIALAVGAIVGLTIMIRAYLHHRGKSLVTCPETRRPAAVHVNAGKAALDAMKSGQVQLQLDQCSRWPERDTCGQECLSQIENEPESCHVWNIAQQWFHGRSCAYCHRPIEQIHWHDHRPALLGPDNKTIQWNDVPPERLPEVFETHSPVCWSCHITETFRRQHPGGFVDRSWNRGAMGECIENEPGQKDVTPAM